MAALVIAVKEIFENNAKALRNFTITVFVFVLQAIITTEDLFECPIEGNGAYGWMFIFVPALVLFLISLVMSDSLKRITQLGCSRSWGCIEEMFKVLTYSLVAGCLWIFWALLQKDYYTCAVAGSKTRLNNVTGQEKKDLTKEFEVAAKESQIYGFSLLAVILGIPLLFLTIRRCCCRRPLSSIPSLFQYEKLEAESAEQTLKEKIENYAKAQGKGKAESLFSQNMIVKNPDISAIISNAHTELSKNEEYKGKMKTLDQYKEVEAQEVAQTFECKTKELAKEEVGSTFQDKSSPKYKNYNPLDFVQIGGNPSII